MLLTLFLLFKSANQPDSVIFLIQLFKSPNHQNKLILCLKKNTKTQVGMELPITITLSPGYLHEGGVRGVRKPQNRTPHWIFSRIPKPRVHVGHNMKADVSKTCDIF